MSKSKFPLTILFEGDILDSDGLCPLDYLTSSDFADLVADALDEWVAGWDGDEDDE
jgi:hypothetical protein